MNSTVIVVLVVVIGIGAYFVLARSQRDRAETKDNGRAELWTELGGTRASNDFPVEFLGKERGRKWTWYRPHGATAGGVTLTKMQYADGNGYSEQMLTFVANPYHGPELRQFVSADTNGMDAREARSFDFGDTSVLAASWERAGTFLASNRTPFAELVRFSKYWIYVLGTFGNISPRQANVEVAYLTDLSMAIQGKATSGADHITAYQDAVIADRLPGIRR